MASRWRCWCRPPCWPSSITKPFSSAWGGFPSRSRWSAASARRPSRRRCWRSAAKKEVDVLIGTHRLLQRDVKFADLGPGGHRRGAALRRCRQGAPQAHARDGGCADAVGHADPAHALPEPDGRARHERDPDPPARAAGHRNLHRAGLRRTGARGGAAGGEPRRPGIRSAQPHPDHRVGAKAPGGPAAGHPRRRGPRADDGKGRWRR